MSFLTVWFGAVASESSSALVDGDVRAPVANHWSMAARLWKTDPSRYPPVGTLQIRA